MIAIPLPGQPVRGSKSGEPIMAVFDLLGRTWAMGILWTLNKHGPSTFRGLQELCGSVSPTVLNKRLKELREAGLVERSENGYRATAMGEELYSMLVPLGAWSQKWAEVIGQK
ncbi:winged helix-turn-helix transcriptional regulator [Stappia sediminis]|uniref:winged helix-turn-helix transcriptional regulator n=1 Tax=Stappia sediminis TaxID=2692190 RepID=UPI0019266D9D|nr:helix-turn-helix domain-containing protein [Stappia sediminis]